MKENYVKPQIIVRNTHIHSYVICATGNPPGGIVPGSDVHGDWADMYTKDRNDIWDSGNDEASAW